jgi:MazG family protein
MTNDNMNTFYQNAGDAFIRLLTIMGELREKCPWDKKQTIHSLRTLTIEEMYELTDSIIDNDWKGIKEELGDVMLHLVFYSHIANEQNEFNIAEVLHNVCNKLVHRHPHIYADVKVENEEDVKRNWEKLKLKEGKTSILSGVPKGLPAMVKAIRLQEKAKQTGFEWDNINDVYTKVEEELGELKEAVENQNINNIEDEFGDVLFSLINYSRFLKIDAETALEKTNKKFMSRFTKMEALAKDKGLIFENLSLTEMDELWNEIKHK